MLSRHRVSESGWTVNIAVTHLKHLDVVQVVRVKLKFFLSGEVEELGVECAQKQAKIIANTK